MTPRLPGVIIGTMKRGPLLLMLLGGCSTFDQDWEELRTDITTLERQHLASDTPIWSRQEPHNFDRHVEDGNAQIPDFIYDHVACKLRDRKDDSIRAETREGFDPGKCLADPGAFRGKFWRVAGRIVRTNALRIDGRPV